MKQLISGIALVTPLFSIFSERIRFHQNAHKIRFHQNVLWRPMFSIKKLWKPKNFPARREETWGFQLKGWGSPMQYHWSVLFTSQKTLQTSRSLQTIRVSGVGVFLVRNSTDLVPCHYIYIRSHYIYKNHQNGPCGVWGGGVFWETICITGVSPYFIYIYIYKTYG